MAHEQDCSLYRLYDETGDLLYVGISVDPGKRLAQHRSDKPWWTDAVTITIQHMPSRRAALTAEEEAIKTERPRYNTMHRSADAPANVEDHVVHEDLQDLIQLTAYRAVHRAVKLCGGSPEDSDEACAALHEALQEGMERYQSALEQGLNPASAWFEAACAALPMPTRYAGAESD